MHIGHARHQNHRAQDAEFRFRGGRGLGGKADRLHRRKGYCVVIAAADVQGTAINSEKPGVLRSVSSR